MKNAEIAQMFETIADVLEIQGANQFRVNTYRRTSRLIGELTEDIEVVDQEGRLGQIRGIGKGTIQKIEEYLRTGHITAFEEAKGSIPKSALEMLRIPGLGPKTVGMFLNDLDIKSVDELEAAIQAGRLDGVKGIGEKTITNIRHGIELLRSSAGRHLLGNSMLVADEIVSTLKEDPAIDRIQAAGSLRRCRETIGDIDILATVGSDDEDAATGIIAQFAELSGVQEVLAKGSTKGSVRVAGDLQVDLRVVPTESLGAALQYFTGSKDHNVRLRGIAKDVGLKINEYGVFRGDDRVAGQTEEDVYGALGLPWIPPELREDRGEIEAAQADELPLLVTEDEIRGEMHAHTTYSDGALSVLEMARAAKAFGHKFLVITDHSHSLTVANGLDEDRLARQGDEIDEAREKLKGFAILKGTEVDILADGALDFSDKALAALDWVIASVHSRFKMSEEEMTERVCRAIRNPFVNAIGHPTGRLIGQREAYPLDMTRVIETCAETGTALELNAHQDRLDLNDMHCRMAMEAGAKIMIGSDAHHPDHFWMMRLGVGTARRGWLGEADVVNTWTAKRIHEFVKAKRK